MKRATTADTAAEERGAHGEGVQRAMKRLRLRLSEVGSSSNATPLLESRPRGRDYEDGYKDCAAHMKIHQELCCQYAAEEMQELIRREKEAWLSQVEEDRRAQLQFARPRVVYAGQWSNVSTPWMLNGPFG